MESEKNPLGGGLVLKILAGIGIAALSIFSIEAGWNGIQRIRCGKRMDPASEIVDSLRERIRATSSPEIAAAIILDADKAVLSAEQVCVDDDFDRKPAATLRRELADILVEQLRGLAGERLTNTP